MAAGRSRVTSVQPRGPYAGSAARREQIVHAARASFVEHGVDAASLRDIAARAGMTHAGLLHHFSSKNELLLAVLRQRDTEDVRNAWPGAPEEHAGAGPGGLSRVLQNHQDSADFSRLWAELTASAARPDHPAHDFFAERYAQVRVNLAEHLRARAMQDDALRDQVDPELAGPLLAAVLDGLQTQWLLNHDLPVETLLDHFLSLILRPGKTLSAQPGSSPSTAPSPARSDRSVSDGEGAARETSFRRAGIRRQLLDQATRLFAAQGYERTSIQDIAEASGCSKAAVLYHWPGKADLFADAVRPAIADLTDLVTDLRAVQSEQRRDRGLSALVDLTLRHRILSAVLTHIAYPTESPPLAGLTQGLEDLPWLLADPQDPHIPTTVRFALLGLAAYCRTTPDGDDPTLNAALSASLARLVSPNLDPIHPRPILSTDADADAGPVSLPPVSGRGRRRERP